MFAKLSINHSTGQTHSCRICTVLRVTIGQKAYLVYRYTAPQYHTYPPLLTALRVIRVRTMRVFCIRGAMYKKITRMILLLLLLL